MQKKERLYVADIIEEPVVSYPSYYLLSKSLLHDEILRARIEAIHLFDFNGYRGAQESDEIFAHLESRQFPIYKEYFVVGYFGGRVMYLEPQGWKSMPITRESFDMSNWLLYESI